MALLTPAFHPAAPAILKYVLLGKILKVIGSLAITFSTDIHAGRALGRNSLW